MNFLKKGPELKLSEIKVPDFVQDVYYDLKDRHLLPVAAILLIAIVAVPIAISGKSESAEEPSGAPEAGASTANSVQTGAMVAEAMPGLRKYETRLKQRDARDPFDATDTAASGDAATEGGSGESEGTSSGSSTYTESPESGSSYSPPVPSETRTESKLTHYSYAIDVRITGGTGENKKSTVRRNLPPLSMLPSRETPAIVYMGTTKDGQKAVMTVSSDVQAIFGDGKCALGSQTCQLLVMEVGLPETFVYGGAGKTYTIELLKAHLVESDKVNKAALGDPNKKNGKTKNQSLAADSVVTTSVPR